jgi:hypothetical protein
MLFLADLRDSDQLRDYLVDIVIGARAQRLQNSHDPVDDVFVVLRESIVLKHTDEIYNDQRGIVLGECTTLVVDPLNA